MASRIKVRVFKSVTATICLGAVAVSCFAATAAPIAASGAGRATVTASAPDNLPWT